ncbi:MAG TPA: amino acid ABC transporter permease [Acidimicrobiales bacterium]|nr:amino acid ABC transporter permease [Acidimicrobiales bacterium]
MTAPFLGDALGPRGRRTTRIVSVLSALVIAGFVAVAISRLGDRGQLDESRWEPFTDPSVQRFLLEGLRATVEVAVVSMIGAIVIGALMALARLSRTPPVRWLATTYVEFFRGVPLILLIFFSAFGLPSYGVDLSVFWYLALGLIIYNGAVLGEIFRAGILSLDRGQSEAAYSLGLTYWQSMLLVVIPQAARRMIPAIVSQLVTLLKDTSLGAAIGYFELLRRARVTGEFYVNPLQALFVAAVMYIIVNFALSRLARWLEVRQRRRFGAGSISVTGVEDLAVVGAQAQAAMGGAGGTAT